MNREDHFTFNWKIKNFSMCKETEDWIKSPHFTIGCLDKNCLFSLEFYPGNLNNASMLNLINITAYSQNVELKVKVEIVSIHDEVIASRVIESISSADLCKQQTRTYIENASIYTKLKNCPGDSFIVRYHLRKINNNEEGHCQCEAETNFVTKQHVAVWNRRQYFPLQPEFELTAFSPSKYPLKLHFNADEDPVLIDMRLTDNCVLWPVRVKGMISLLDGMKLEHKSNSEFHSFESRNHIWRFPNFISKEELHTSEYIKLTLIVLTRRIDGIVKTYVFRDRLVEEFTTNTHSLSNDLRAVYISKNNSDVKLKVNDELIDAHKFILTVRSPVFAAMFQQDMVEMISGVVNITDIDVDTVKTLVEYMYTDSVTIEDFGRTFELMMAAHKYQIQSLVDKCASFLASSLGIDNILEIVKASDMIGHAFLKANAMNFINVNARAILSMPTWIPWVKNNVVLSSEIVCKLSKKIEGIISDT